MDEEQAREYGRKARKNGIKCLAIKDIKFIQALPDPDEQGVTPESWRTLLDAWDAGWKEEWRSEMKL